MPPEAVVIGGGPAGLSAALGLLRSGLPVKVLEKQIEWSGRVCGSFLSPEAVQHLRWLDVFDDLVENGGAAVHKVVIETPFGDLINVPIKANGESGLAVPRQILENTLEKKVKLEGGDVLRGEMALDYHEEG
ncbi:MAG: FAD-dependent monooxygenase, partial [Elusimicrobia bacterium]|nr:FAD-dependent monooxygenase [Candidatus Obscuribacterium magneticum]